ncbi:MAG: hypothetical protein RBQ91_00845 [Acholeplasma sp.]|nr:hypothetical protein [Acholeplasma sp.]
MLDWLKSLTPETIIIFGTLFTLFVMLIFVLIRLKRIASRVGEQEFYINESLLEIDGIQYINLTIINKAFSTNHINVIGVELRNISHPLEEKVVMIAPRSKHQTRFDLNIIKPFVFQNRKKYRKFKIYVENEIGLRKVIKPKVNNRFMKREFLKLMKAEKIERKKKRFESGQYNLLERTGLIIGLLFRPIAKLKRHMALSTNKALRESEIRRQQKKEHDAIKYKLDQDAFKLSELRIREQAIKENRTRELELESLKKAKELEIERIKIETLESELTSSKLEVEQINSEKEAHKQLKKEKNTSIEVSTNLSVEEPKSSKQDVEKDITVEGSTNTDSLTHKTKKPRNKKTITEKPSSTVSDSETSDVDQSIE